LIKFVHLAFFKMSTFNNHVFLSVFTCLILSITISSVDSYALIKVCSISDLKAVKTKICSVYKRSVRSDSTLDSNNFDRLSPDVPLTDSDWNDDDSVDSDAINSIGLRRLFKRNTQLDLLTEALANAAAAAASSSSTSSLSTSLSSSGSSKLGDSSRSLSKTNFGSKSKYQK
jgi:hypothetical protein